VSSKEDNRNLSKRQSLVATFSPARPAAGEYASFYANYVALATEEDVISALAKQLDDTLALLRGLSEEVAKTRHAPYTWSVKQVVGHVTDAERVFSYRAMRFARNDPTALPSFDENAYVNNANFDNSVLTDLLAEFEHLRRANISFFRQLPAEAWSRTGIASDNPVTVRALAYVIVGHTRHHMNIMKKRLSAK
jgi:hypothetical protein